MSLNTLRLIGGSEAAMTFFISETKEFAKAIHGEERASPGCIASRQDFQSSSFIERISWILEIQPS